MSAYAVLGLDPDADAASVERAYKRLIKAYHPDREGGDPSRAAEITRAYRELRSTTETPGELVLAEEDDVPAEPGHAWARAAIVLLLGLAVVLLATGPLAAYLRQFVPHPPSLSSRGIETRGASSMDQDLDLGAVDGAVRQAVEFARGHDNAALLNASRDCHERLGAAADIGQFDRCVAFDDAVVQLRDRDPMWDRGPFSELAVTRRQWSAASSLSSDYLAIDGRLDRIRRHVELLLAPAAPPPTVPVVVPKVDLDEMVTAENATSD